MKRLALQLGILIGLTLIAGAATKLFHPNAPGWRLSAYGPEGPAAAAEKSRYRITASEIREILKDGGEILWIDARLKRKFDAGHIEGAYWVGEQPRNALTPDLHNELLAGAAKDKTVVYCEPKCDKAIKAARELRDLLLRDVYHFEGDFTEFR